MHVFDGYCCDVLHFMEKRQKVIRSCTSCFYGTADKKEIFMYRQKPIYTFHFF